MQKVKNSFIDMAYGSDHSMITLMINLNDTERGKSYWKHNSLLTDKEYLNIINKHIAAIKKQYAVPVYNSEQIENIQDSEIQFIISDQLFLEVLLMELHGQSISYASFKHKERNKVEQILIENIRSTENNLEKNKIENLENLKTQLNDIWQEKLKGHVIRSRAKHIDQGEKPTKYFCGLEQLNYISKTISKIEKEDGSLVTDQKEILKETESFYKCLYSKKNNESEHTELDSYIDSDAVTKLTNVESEKLEGLLSFAEISETLLKMKNDKNPGLSGFSADFF